MPENWTDEREDPAVVLAGVLREARERLPGVPAERYPATMCINGHLSVWTHVPELAVVLADVLTRSPRLLASYVGPLDVCPNRVVGIYWDRDEGTRAWTFDPETGQLVESPALAKLAALNSVSER